VVPNNGVNISILNCRFDTTANWDTTANAYHHDGIHYFGSTGVPQSFIIAGNIFTGDWGANNTAHIFNEQAAGNIKIYNNLFIVYPGRYLNDGCLLSGGTNELIANNTFVGAGTANSTAITTASYTNTIVNNLFTGFNCYVGNLAGTALTMSNNLYANQAPGGIGWSSFAAWIKSVGEVNSSYSKAIVVNADGTLPLGSPAIGAGANLSSIFNTDYAGNPRIGPWTIGAYAVIVSGSVPLVSLMASPAIIYTDTPNSQPSTLTWSSVNATSVTLSGFGPVPFNGSTNVSPAQNTTYTVTATSPNGTNSASATVTSLPSPPGQLLRH
jgi:hypothetical protein